MSDDLRDKFDSEEEYEDYNRMYNDYKNQTGSFDINNIFNKFVEIQNFVYENIVEKGKKFVIFPKKFTKMDNLPLCMFEFDHNNVTLSFVIILN